MPTNWRKHGHISQPHVPVELSVPFCHLIPAFPKWSKSASKETAHQSAQKLRNPPVPNSTPAELLPFIPSEGSYGHILGAKQSFAAFTATSSLLLQFLPLSSEPFYFKNILLWFQMVFLPLPTPHWYLMFFHKVMLPSSVAHFLFQVKLLLSPTPTPQALYAAFLSSHSVVTIKFF